MCVCVCVCVLSISELFLSVSLSLADVIALLKQRNTPDDPQLVSAYVFIAFAHQCKNDRKEAIEYYKQGLAMMAGMYSLLYPLLLCRNTTASSRGVGSSLVGVYIYISN